MVQQADDACLYFNNVADITEVFQVRLSKAASQTASQKFGIKVRANWLRSTSDFARPQFFVVKGHCGALGAGTGAGSRARTRALEHLSGRDNSRASWGICAWRVCCCFLSADKEAWRVNVARTVVRLSGSRQHARTAGRS